MSSLLGSQTFPLGVQPERAMCHTGCRKHVYSRDELNTITFPPLCLGCPGRSDGKESACRAGDLGSIPGLGRSPREGNGNALRSSGLENPTDRGAWYSLCGRRARPSLCLGPCWERCLAHLFAVAAWP